MEKMLVAIRIRGDVALPYDAKQTLAMLNLHHKNWCSIYPNNASMKGMINKVKDYVTYGELSEETYKELMEKKADEYKQDDDNCLVYNKKKYKKFIRLSPPLKGYGREGTKKPFTKNGALGYRADKINELIKRMM
jgi:large subunit ribosomal protein L30